MEPAGETRIFVCPLCSQRIKASAQREGKRAKCGRCQRLIVLVPEEKPTTGDVVEDIEQKQEWWDNPALEIQEPQQRISAQAMQERMRAMQQKGVKATYVHPYAAGPRTNNLWLRLFIGGLLVIALIIALAILLG
jgi:hypothetical protein